MSSTTAVMLQDRLNDIERNICDGIDFRQELNEAYALADELEAENAKLRELCADMWFWGYEGHMDSESQEWQMKHIDGVLDRMRELGVEVG